MWWLQCTKAAQKPPFRTCLTCFFSGWQQPRARCLVSELVLGQKDTSYSVLMPWPYALWHTHYVVQSFVPRSPQHTPGRHVHMQSRLYTRTHAHTHTRTHTHTHTHTHKSLNMIVHVEDMYFYTKLTHPHTHWINTLGRERERDSLLVMGRGCRRVGRRLGRWSRTSYQRESWEEYTVVKRS